MPTPALLLLIATLLPLAAFVILLFIGRRMGTPLAGVVGTVFIAASFACSMGAMVSWLNGGTAHDSVLNKEIAWGVGKNPINIPIPFLPVGEGVNQPNAGFLDIGIYVDSLTIAMFAMVTLISTLIFIFSIGYMREDKRFPLFFTYLSLFGFSMLGLVLGGTLLQLFIFWELVGLCSYLLIGFWYEKKSASNAAIKAFVTNRIGDFGFLIGFGILFWHLGNATLPSLWVTLGNAGQGTDVALPGGGVFTAGLLTVMGIGLFCGAMGKSAQFPLHVWLPDAMEGPTPVSALIHAATMVAAGVYLVGRIFPILTPDAKLFIAIIGCVTLAMAALIAIVQSDIKKVLAYSTLSQLGYMILAMGIGSWVGGLFHLITHAFFKALLFLGSGSVIHAAHHEQEMSQYGGLMRKIPITAITFGIAVLAIAGTPFLSAYYSKDLILANAAAFGALADIAPNRSPSYWLFFIVPTIIAYVTAFYMTRCWMLTFWGKPRNEHVYENAHEVPTMWIPLVVLAVFSVIAGYELMGVRYYLSSAIRETDNYCTALQAKIAPGAEKFAGVATAWPAYEPGHATEAPAQAAVPEIPPAAHDVAAPHVAAHADVLEHGYHLMHTYVFWAFLVGIGLGFLLYMNGYSIAKRLVAIPPLGWIHTWLYRKMYFDELYFSVFVAITMGLSKLSAWFDSRIVDGLVNFAALAVRKISVAIGLHDQYVVDGAVNGIASLTQELGAAVRAPQTGRIRMYVTILMIAVAVGLAGAIIVAIS